MCRWALFGTVIHVYSTEEEIDGPGFLDLTEEDIKQLTDKMGLIKKVQRVIREVSD